MEELSGLIDELVNATENAEHAEEVLREIKTKFRGKHHGMASTQKEPARDTEEEPEGQLIVHPHKKSYVESWKELKVPLKTVETADTGNGQGH